MSVIVAIVGWSVIGFISLILLYSLFQWLLYGQVGNSTSQVIRDGKIYVNGKFVKKYNGGSVSMVNGSVYVDGELVYKHKKKFRWEK